MKSKTNGAMKIESGIPLPGRRHGFSQLLRTLKVGQSVVVNMDLHNANSLGKYALGAGCYACRTVESGIRIWRTK